MKGLNLDADNYADCIMLGMETPVDEFVCDCGCEDLPLSIAYRHLLKQVESPSLLELDLARRPHRWLEIRKLLRAFLTNIIKEVTNLEKNLLNAIGLPPIEDIREFILNEKVLKYSALVKEVNFDIPEAEIKKILQSFQEVIIGSASKVTVDDVPIIPFYQQSSFAVGLNKSRAEIEKLIGGSLNLPEGVIPDWQNLYLMQIRKNSLARLKTKLGKDYLKEVFEILQQGAEQGLNPLRIGSMIHKRVGEGQAWYWNRLTRSETAIALDAAFVAEANNDGVPYEQWSTGGNPCPICAALDGKIWRVGEGPRVVYDTHPHCLCVKYPYIGSTDRVMPAVDHSEWPYT